MDATQHAISFLLDRSGSMAAIRDQTIASVNAYINEMRDNPPPALSFTLTQFDSVGIDVMHPAVPIAEVPLLTEKNFVPRAATPLIDALCMTILKASAKYAPTDRVVIVAMTDGRENASREFTMADLRALIAKHGSWDFVFLGASVDAYQDAATFGIGADSTMSYRADSMQSALSAYASVARRGRRFFETGEKRGFSRAEKVAAGDEFDPTA